MTTAPIATTAPITTATAAEAERAIAVLTLAFSSDPVNCWAWPDPRQYLASLPAFVRAFAGRAFERGTAYCIDGYTGAALWLPPGVYPDEDALVALLQSTSAEAAREDLPAVLEQMSEYQPSEPH
jgi:hypothetical protein